MNVIYSIGSRFGESGIGYIAYQFVRHFYGQGYLKKLFALSVVPTEIEKMLVCTCPGLRQLSRLLKVPNRFISLNDWASLRDSFFDRWVSRRLESADIFHGWLGQSFFSIKHAKRKGMVTFLEHPSAHALYQQRLLEREYEHCKVNFRPDTPAIIRRNLAEYEAVDFIVVPSRFVYDSFVQQGVSSKKIILVPYGVDTDRFSVRQPEEHNGIFRVVFVGQIGLRKGVHYLLQAWSELRLAQAELIVAGWTHPDIVHILKDYRNVENIHIKDFISEPAALYQTADICVFPSIEDGFGLVVLEAMACGKPVIITENTGAKDVVVDGQDGFVIPAGSLEKLKEKILYFYNNRQVAHSMGEVARKRVQKYSWQSSAEALYAAYKTILAQHISQDE
ncbi:MAG: glycosyltransferase family 4 protein [Candidatus Omnitrophota bacterium]